MKNVIHRTADVLVIGAGMAGLSAAAALQKAGRKTLVIDKGRRIGGRMATRSVGGIKSFQIHGWRYSKPKQTDPLRCAVVSLSPPLLLAGDAFGGPRVEGAALSGWAAAEAVIHAAGTPS